MDYSKESVTFQVHLLLIKATLKKTSNIYLLQKYQESKHETVQADKKVMNIFRDKMKMEEDMVVGESVGGAVVDINGEVMWDGQVVVHGQSEQVGGCKLLSKRRNSSKKKMLQQ